MSEWQKVVVLGLLEGLTEFLPVSSTAHLFAADLLRFGAGIGGTFAIVIQLGAILAVFAYHAAELRDRVRAFPRDRAARRFWLCLGLAFLPAAALGFLLRAWIKAVLFASPAASAWALIVGGIALFAVERPPRRAVAPGDSAGTSPRARRS